MDPREAPERAGVSPVEMVGLSTTGCCAAGEVLTRAIADLEVFYDLVGSFEEAASTPYLPGSP